MPIVDDRFEKIINETFENACKGSSIITNNLSCMDDLIKDPILTNLFYISSINGFRNAQDVIVEQLLELDNKHDNNSRYLKLVFRKLADSIAWQIISKRMHIARRFYKDNTHYSLSDINFDSSLHVANELNKESDYGFSLISDITTFVQVGDLLCFNPSKKTIEIVEIKTGEINRKIIEFLDFYKKSKCDNFLKHFISMNDNKTIDQMNRMVRQYSRMDHIREFAKNDSSTDPDLNTVISTNKEPIVVNSYDDIIAELINKARINGWAIDVIDGCLFVGAYTGIYNVHSKDVFTKWFKGCGGKVSDPILNILACTSIPLAYPIFIRSLPSADIMDIVTGRVTVYLGLHLDEFISKSQQQIVSLRWGSRRESSQHRNKVGGLKRDHQVLFAQYGKKEAVMSDGLIVRILFNETTPNSALDCLMTTFDLLPDESLPG